MRTRIHEKIEALGGTTENQATLEEKATVEQWRDQVFLSQEINKELFDLNVTAIRILSSLKYGFVIIGLVLLYIIFRH